MARARAGEGPTLIEAVTFRVGGHMSADPAAYRDGAEVEQWARRDPIARHEARLAGEGMLDAAGAERLRAEVRAEVEAAMQ
ncbi:MAG: thiamine pyrophosphate-dependent dehydrogenase E1 component subunit alpha, partial [Burkholderiales bacterium]